MEDCLPGFDNARDLGGLPLRNGGMTVPGAIIRSETPTKYLFSRDLDPTPVFARVIDLRSIEEAEALPHPMANDGAYRLRPLIDPTAEALRGPNAEVTLGEIYKGSLGRNAANIAAIMIEISDSPEGAILISCASGKDRTGMIIAVLLRLAGVPDEAIGEDYERTEHSMREVLAKQLGEGPGGRSGENTAQLQNAKPENIIAMLGHIDEAYGTAEQYLLSIGLNRLQVDRLSLRMLAPTS